MKKIISILIAMLCLTAGHYSLFSVHDAPERRTLIPCALTLSWPTTGFTGLAVTLMARNPLKADKIFQMAAKSPYALYSDFLEINTKPISFPCALTLSWPATGFTDIAVTLMAQNRLAKDKIFQMATEVPYALLSCIKSTNPTPPKPDIQQATDSPPAKAPEITTVEPYAILGNPAKESPSTDPKQPHYDSNSFADMGSPDVQSPEKQPKKSPTADTKEPAKVDDIVKSFTDIGNLYKKSSPSTDHREKPTAQTATSLLDSFVDLEVDSEVDANEVPQNVPDNTSDIKYFEKTPLNIDDLIKKTSNNSPVEINPHFNTKNPKTLQSIQRGFDIHSSLDNQKIPNKHEDLSSIVDVLHYYYFLACQKNQKHDSGAFIIEDNDFRIYNLLVNYRETHSRISSHLKEYYAHNKKYHQHYGIDVPINSLPIPEMQHILFGKVDEKKQLLFVKMETYGVGFWNLPGHSYEYLISFGNKLYNTDADEAPNTRKERVPASLVAIFTTIIKPLTPADEFAKIAIKALGISAMKEAVDSTLRRLQNIQGKIAPELYAKHLDNLAKLQKMFAQYDNLEVRIGREISLISRDFNKELYHAGLKRINSSLTN
jgi:hypothetical protein